MPSPTPMKSSGTGLLLGDGADHAALGRAVELGEDQAGEAERVVEGLHLRERVLPGVRVEHEQHLVRRARRAPSPRRASPCGSPPSGAAASAAARRCRRSPRRCLRARAAPSASNTTAPGSPDSCAITGTLLRSPQATSCSRAAARKVSPAASSTLLPCDCSHFASLPIEVVLPEPLTPAIMITKRLARAEIERFLQRREQVGDGVLERALERRAVRGLLACALPATSACVAAHAAVGLQQRVSSSS